MKFTLVTFGTEGDTRPLVALCIGLQTAGHEVTLFADRSTLHTAESFGIPARALQGDMKATVGPGGSLTLLMEDGGDASRMAVAASEIAADNTESWIREVVEHAESERSDAILFSGVASYAGLAAGECAKLPAIGLGIIPIFPTRDYPSAFMALPFKLPGWLNYFTHVAIGSLIWILFRGKINDARFKVKGLPPRYANYWDYPVIYGLSRHIHRQPPDWPEHLQVVGPWQLPAGDYKPPQPLVDFLESGDKPIYVGFGSMAGFNREKLLNAIIEGIDGQRCIFYPGWSGMDVSKLPSNFLVVSDTPHDWLLPRMSLAVIHGGAGTSHAACKAGIPSVVLPFAGDQPFWAERLEDIGVAPRYVPQSKMDGKKLKEMIAWAQRPEVVERAKKLGEAICQEDGVTAGVKAIEHFYKVEKKKLLEPPPKPNPQPLLRFYLLTTGLSVPFWLGTGLSGLQLAPGLPASALMAFTPAISGLVLNHDGPMSLLRKAFDFEKINNKKWLVVAALAHPAISVASYYLLKRSGVAVPDFVLPSPLKLLGMSAAFFASALGEELGYTGYALEPMKTKFGLPLAGLLQGTFSALWHAIPLIQAGRPKEWVFWQTQHILFSRLATASLSELSGGSVFVASVFHAVGNICWRVFPVDGSHYDPRSQAGFVSLLGMALAVI